jgi:hypothetical protein
LSFFFSFDFSLVFIFGIVFGPCLLIWILPLCLFYCRLSFVFLLVYCLLYCRLRFVLCLGFCLLCWLLCFAQPPNPDEWFKKWWVIQKGSTGGREKRREGSIISTKTNHR